MTYRTKDHQIEGELIDFHGTLCLRNAYGYFQICGEEIEEVRGADMGCGEAEIHGSAGSEGRAIHSMGPESGTAETSKDRLPVRLPVNRKRRSVGDDSGE